MGNGGSKPDLKEELESEAYIANQWGDGRRRGKKKREKTSKVTIPN